MPTGSCTTVVPVHQQLDMHPEPRFMKCQLHKMNSLHPAGPWTSTFLLQRTNPFCPYQCLSLIQRLCSSSKCLPQPSMSLYRPSSSALLEQWPEIRVQKGEQNKRGFSVLSPAMIPYVSWDKSKQKLIVCVCSDSLEQVLDSVRMSLGMTALRAHDCAIIRQLVWTQRPRMRSEKQQVECSATDNYVI